MERVNIPRHDEKKDSVLPFFIVRTHCFGGFKSHSLVVIPRESVLEQTYRYHLEWKTKTRLGRAILAYLFEQVV